MASDFKSPWLPHSHWFETCDGTQKFSSGGLLRCCKNFRQGVYYDVATTATMMTAWDAGWWREVKYYEVWYGRGRLMCWDGMFMQRRCHGRSRLQDCMQICDTLVPVEGTLEGKLPAKNRFLGLTLVEFSPKFACMKHVILVVKLTLVCKFWPLKSHWVPLDN